MRPPGKNSAISSKKGKWTTAAKIAAERAEAEAQRKADAHWRPLIQSWKAGLARREKRAESEKLLAAVTDPRAEALRRVTGKDLGEDREAWLKWWLESRGYKYIPPKDRDKATVDMQVALPVLPHLGPAAGHEWKRKQCRQRRLLHGL